MNWVVAKIRWILLASGALTCAMFLVALVPEAAVDVLFDRTLENSLARVIVPSWAALVGVMGAMLLHGAFVPQARMQAMTVAGSGKLIFLGMMLVRGRQFLDEKVGLVLALDAAMVVLFTLFLVGVRRARAGHERVSQPSPAPAVRAEPIAAPPASSSSRVKPALPRAAAPSQAGRRPGSTI